MLNQAPRSGAVQLVTTELLKLWKPRAVIMTGIAFGKDSKRQRIGDVLVSDRVISYEPARISENSVQQRGTHPNAGVVLLNRFRNAIGWTFSNPSGEVCSVHIGPILSGEKLIDDVEFKNKLFDEYPNALGGEMEGSGVAAAADREKREWIIVKGICDWGDGTKNKLHQEFAAAASISLVVHVLNQPGAFDALE
ncbi:MAG: hypothetical protein IH991_01330 [Planctomycetes bacterium]|nr:hypothetical protein [Planctomycetota bacterium]